MKKPVQVQDYEKDKEEDEGEVILTSLMGVPVRCKAISGMYHVNVLVNVNVNVLKEDNVEEFCVRRPSNATHRFGGTLRTESVFCAETRHIEDIEVNLSPIR